MNLPGAGIETPRRPVTDRGVWLMVRCSGWCGALTPAAGLRLGNSACGHGGPCWGARRGAVRRGLSEVGSPVASREAETVAVGRPGQAPRMAPRGPVRCTPDPRPSIVQASVRPSPAQSHRPCGDCPHTWAADTPQLLSLALALDPAKVTLARETASPHPASEPAFLCVPGAPQGI